MIAYRLLDPGVDIAGRLCFANGLNLMVGEDKTKRVGMGKGASRLVISERLLDLGVDIAGEDRVR